MGCFGVSPGKRLERDHVVWNQPILSPPCKVPKLNSDSHLKQLKGAIVNSSSSVDVVPQEVTSSIEADQHSKTLCNLEDCVSRTAEENLWGDCESGGWSSDEQMESDLFDIGTEVSEIFTMTEKMDDGTTGVLRYHKNEFVYE